MIMQICPKDFWIEKAIELGQIKEKMEYSLNNSHIEFLWDTEENSMLKNFVRAMEIWSEIDFMKCNNELPDPDAHIIPNGPLDYDFADGQYNP